MKSSELIHRLSANVTPVRPVVAESVFFAALTAGSALVLGAWALALPLRASLPAPASAPSFWIESALWLALAASAANYVYRSSIPGLPSRSSAWMVAGSVLALIASIAVGLPRELVGADLRAQLLTEWDLYRGRCGLLIFAIAAVGAAGLYAWAKRGASVTPGRTGAAIAVTAAASSAALMQFVCEHGNPLHLFLWHVLPVAVLTGLSARAAKTLLRW